MGSMVHYFLMISDSMGKHGEHGNSLFSLLQIACAQNIERKTRLLTDLMILLLIISNVFKQIPAIFLQNLTRFLNQTTQLV